MIYKAIKKGDIAKLQKEIAKAPELINKVSHAVNARDNPLDHYGMTPLMYAAVVANLEACKVLVEAGSEINMRNDGKATALMYSLSSGNGTEICDFLLKEGADPNIQDQRGETPLMRAHTPEQMKLILEAGVEVDCRDGFGATALIKRAISEKSDALELCKLLIDAGADVNAVNTRGEGAIDKALIVGNREICSLLLDRGFDIKKLDEDTIAFAKRKMPEIFGNM